MNQWNRKRFAAWVDVNNISLNHNKFAKMSHFSNNWCSKPWHSSPFKRQRCNEYSYRPLSHQNRRQGSSNLFVNRWEPLQNGMEINFRRENVRNDLNSSGDSGNYRSRLNYHFDKCKDILQEDPNARFQRMQKLFWDRLDPKDDIRLIAKTSNRNARIPVYDGVTPIGKEGISKVWLCSICNVLILDTTDKKLHLKQKNHYKRYANFCKKYADEKLLKLELEKKAKKEKKERKSSKKNLDTTSSSKQSEDNMEENEKGIKSAKANKEVTKDKQNKLQNQEKSPRIDETISIEESLNYDFLE
ncbi:uncharacterized protein isoform X2 [Rhodnius prolixus]|uniref:uncharacterized protein isoform X2 n=1 Tax=Rhodnius prolixus TaxID=13249 RepID=UPI003D189569